MYKAEPKTIRIHKEMARHPDYTGNDVLIVQPDEDLVDLDPNKAEFKLGETVNLLIPAGEDGTEWSSTGKVLEIDYDAEPLLLAVRVHWGEATLKV